jgi:hypothetical protein
MTGLWTKALLLALAALAIGATALAAQPYGQAEPIGQSGRPVATPNYGTNQRGSPLYVGPPAVSTYGYGHRYPSGVTTRAKPAKKP